MLSSCDEKGHAQVNSSGGMRSGCQVERLGGPRLLASHTEHPSRSGIPPDCRLGPFSAQLFVTTPRQ